jgi:tetratricopeptide (TPR) repeat protein
VTGRGILALALVSLVLGACARDPAMKAWTDRWLIAERHLIRDEHPMARGHFVILEQTALNPHDAADARLRLAEVARRSGDHATYESMLETEARNSGDLDAEQRARIRWYWSRAVADGGDEPKAEAMMERLMDTQPNSAFAARAFVYLLGVGRQRDPAAFAAWCEAKYAQHHGTELADNLLYEAGRIGWESDTPKGDALAERLLTKIVDKWVLETSGLWDDAVWDLSNLFHKQKRYKDEVRMLRLLLSSRSVTWLGSQQIKNYRFAYMRIGQLLYQVDGLYIQAADHFAQYEVIWPDSVLVDDNLWWQGHALKRAGKTVQAERIFQRIDREFGDFKFARYLREGRPGPVGP